MGVILLQIGLVSTAYYELAFKVFPYVLTPSPDTRVAKLYVGMWLALAYGLSYLYREGFKPCTNKWLIALILYIPLNIHLAPKFPIILNGLDATNFWVWKPLFLCISFFLMFMAVQSMSISPKEINNIFNIMVWCGFIMACYVIIQDSGYDQFFSIRQGDEFRQVTKRVTVGSLGNSTVVASYMAMIIPFAFYLKKWVKGIVIGIGVFLTCSNMAIGAMIVSVSLWLCYAFKGKAIISILILALSCCCYLSWKSYLSPKEYSGVVSRVTNDNGRFRVWKELMRIMKEEEFGSKEKSRYSFTGTGIGSYPFIIASKIKTQFAQVHNEYLEVYATMGLVGISLFLLAIWSMSVGVLKGIVFGSCPLEVVTLYSSFICIALVALGSFPWQLSPHNFYTTLIVGLLHNRRLVQ